MRRLFWIVVGAGLGALAMWGSLQYHLLRTDQGFTYVPKRNVTLTDTYVDVRAWTVNEWTKHPDLVWALAQNGRSEVMGDSRIIETSLKGIFDAQPRR